VNWHCEARLQHSSELCLRVILNEEWQHRLYAERDLDILERQPG